MLLAKEVTSSRVSDQRTKAAKLVAEKTAPSKLKR